MTFSIRCKLFGHAIGMVYARKDGTDVIGCYKCGKVWLWNTETGELIEK